MRVSVLPSCPPGPCSGPSYPCSTEGLTAPACGFQGLSGQSGRWERRYVCRWTRTFSVELRASLTTVVPSSDRSEPPSGVLQAGEQCRRQVSEAGLTGARVPPHWR